MHNPDSPRFVNNHDGKGLIDTQMHEKVLRAQVEWAKTQAAKKRRSHRKPKGALTWVP